VLGSASDENIVESVLRDVYQGRFLPTMTTTRQLCLPTSPISAAHGHRQCAANSELASNSPAVHRSAGTVISPAGKCPQVEYCSKHVCLFACLFVCPHTYPRTEPTSTEFLCMLPLAVGALSAPRTCSFVTCYVLTVALTAPDELSIAHLKWSENQ